MVGSSKTKMLDPSLLFVYVNYKCLTELVAAIYVPVLLLLQKKKNCKCLNGYTITVLFVFILAKKFFKKKCTFLDAK
jgi:hypothetical protein